MENKKNRDYTGIFYVVIGAAVIIFALWNLYSDDFERNKAQKKYEEMQEAYIETQTQPVEEKKKDWWSTDVRIELAKLRQINPDIRADRKSVV